MNLRATHHGYAYQDLITGIALVDLMLGTAESVTVDTKGFTGDRFDDLTIGYRTTALKLGAVCGVDAGFGVEDHDHVTACFGP